MKTLINKLKSNTDLDSEDVESAVLHLTTSEFPDEVKGEFLVALAAKGETPDEIAEFARAFLRRATSPMITPGDLPGPLIDLCGTGGDKLGMFNVSTTVCFILASAGAFVVKHGNRGISSRSGGADVLEALGVSIDIEPPRTAACLEKTGLVFLFAQRYHPTFKAVATVRRDLGSKGVVTVFNILGPLLNPVRPPFQLAGLFRPNLVESYANVLKLLDRQAAMVVNGAVGNEFGMDEISISGPTRFAKLQGGVIQSGQLTPEDFDVPMAGIDLLVGGDAKENAAILTGILDGTIEGAKRHIVEVNAASALVICGLATDHNAAMELAREQIASGGALRKLKALKDFC